MPSVLNLNNTNPHFITLQISENLKLAQFH